MKAAYRNWSGVNQPIRMLGMCVDCFLEQVRQSLEWQVMPALRY